jgi:methylmalonyl-CoA mutase
MSRRSAIIPPERVRYLAEIAETCEAADGFVRTQSALARRMYQLQGTIDAIRANVGRTRLEVVEPDARSTVQVTQRVEGEPAFLAELVAMVDDLESELDPDCRASCCASWPAMKRRYAAEKYQFQVRDKVIEQDLTTTTLSGLKVPKVALPAYEDWGDVLTWLLRENAAGDLPLHRGGLPPQARGRGPRAHVRGRGRARAHQQALSLRLRGLPAKRLSTAFDSVTLYGEDPDRRPDIYGKVGNSGVSVASVDDAKKLYSGFDLADPGTSVSMTINGPAPMVLGFYLNAAVDQGCEKFLRAQGRGDAVSAQIDALYAQRGLPRPPIRAPCPRATTASGLLLLGVSGDEVLPRETYEKIRPTC